MEVVIRPFQAADWDGLFFLDRACFEPPYRLEYPRLRALVQDPTIMVIVVEGREGDETAIVGGIFVKHDEAAGRAVVIALMVDPGFRRVGLGTRLINWAERVARTRAVPEVVAPLEAQNAPGAEFLTAMRFVREPGAPPFFDDPAGGDIWRRAVPVQEVTAPAVAQTRPLTSKPPRESEAAVSQEPVDATAVTTDEGTGTAPEAPLQTDSAAPPEAAPPEDQSVPAQVPPVAAASAPIPEAAPEAGSASAVPEPPAPAPTEGHKPPAAKTKRGVSRPKRKRV